MSEKRRVCFYVDLDIHKQFRLICQREGESASQKVEAFEFDYVNAHNHGNPQTLLQSHFRPPELVCFRCRGKFRVLRSVEYVSGLSAQVCDECLEKDRKRGVVKKVMMK